MDLEYAIYEKKTQPIRVGPTSVERVKLHTLKVGDFFTLPNFRVKLRVTHEIRWDRIERDYCIMATKTGAKR